MPLLMVRLYADTCCSVAIACVSSANHSTAKISSIISPFASIAVYCCLLMPLVALLDYNKVELIINIFFILPVTSCFKYITLFAIMTLSIIKRSL